MEQLELDKFEGIVSLPLLLHRSNKWVAEQPAGQRFLRTPDSVESSPSGHEIGDQLCSSDHWVPNRAPPSRAPRRGGRRGATGRHLTAPTVPATTSAYWLAWLQ